MKAGWRHRQRGATFLGILIIGGILAVGVYAGIRLTPLYMEYFAVQRALRQVVGGGDTSASGIRMSLERRWQIEDIKTLDLADVEIKPASGGSTTVRAKYRAQAPLVANISIVVDFDYSVQVGG